MMDTFTILLRMLIAFPGVTLTYVTEPTTGNECPRYMCEYYLMEKFINLQNENAELVERVSQLENQQRSVVSAYVRLSKTTDVKAYERVMYDIEITNIGSAFNLETGQFTAPVSGLYMIDVSVCVASSSHITLNIMRDGGKVGSVRAGDLGWVDCSSGAISIHLTSGSNIWIERGEPSSGPGLFEGRGWNTFTATLIQAD